MIRHKKRHLGNKAVSTVFGSILFMLLIIAVMASIFIVLFQYDESANLAIASMQERAQEKIGLTYLTKDASNNIVNFTVKNYGSIDVKIRGIYIDNLLVSDPSTYSIASIKAQNTLNLTLPTTTSYVPTSLLSITTERGTKTMEYESFLTSERNYTARPRSNFGPLTLNYEKFYYAEIQGNSYPSASGWQPGWTAVGGQEIVWRISVNNTINKSITLNEYSCFTLVPTTGASSQSPWYLETVVHQDLSTSKTIQPFENYVNLTYRYKTPLTDNQKITYPMGTLSNLFLTFYGVISDSTGVKPYGQTIPFEAVTNT